MQYEKRREGGRQRCIRVRLSRHLLILYVCPGLTSFCIFIFNVLTIVLLKGAGLSFLLSEDEPLTPNIDGVTAL